MKNVYFTDTNTNFWPIPNLTDIPISILQWLIALKFKKQVFLRF